MIRKNGFDRIGRDTISDRTTTRFVDALACVERACPPACRSPKLTRMDKRVEQRVHARRWRRKETFFLSFVPFSRSLPRKVNAVRSCLPRMIASSPSLPTHCFTRKRREEKQKSLNIFFEHSSCDDLVESGKYTKFRHIDFIQSTVLYY